MCPRIAKSDQGTYIVAGKKMVFQLGGLTFADPKAQRDAQTHPLSLYRRVVHAPGPDMKRFQEIDFKEQEQRLHGDATSLEKGSKLHLDTKQTLSESVASLYIIVLADVFVSVPSNNKTRAVVSPFAKIESSVESRLTGVDSANLSQGGRDEARLYIMGVDGGSNQSSNQRTALRRKEYQKEASN
ncbi:hypothetical protein O1611_g1134 [Lasiodiplodia mahajangana]|uniref:Uncharacterized protein n=1 Tax=Lasiodiplodia mahajangana TaxID=1108764 RepID=A0ACC2JYA1_9PEZI|nr:hypothetical protein O1611_g1134 [Lasiodiplodia mahajangana]